MLALAKPSFLKERGVALIMVLWMIMVMMTMAATLMYAVKTETQLVTYARSTAQARSFAEAAAHYSVMQLFLPPDKRQLKIGGSPSTWTYQGYSAEIRVIGENGLIDINQANRELLTKVLKALGIVDQDAEKLLDAIEDFRDSDDLKHVNGAEDQDYKLAGLDYGAKDAPFERIEELQQVLGVTPLIYQGLARYLSVNAHSDGVNPMLAPQHVLLLLADGDQAAVDEYIRQREEAEGAWVQPPFGGGLLGHIEQPVYRLQLKIKALDSETAYFEERAIRLLPGRNPPFITYFRVQQPLSSQF
ncbi:MAG TPA: type II secretion system protein GspK [Thiolinea sp.]|nr:type II secretion system protein GspK [Thiolinea sp.]